MKARTFKKQAFRDIRNAKLATAREAIGKIEKNQDVYCLTFGQFSVIDALVHILDEVGPADVTVATWTAADAHLDRARDLIAASSIKSLRLIVDRSFKNRQPGFYHQMRNEFGADCIREFKTHAKFMLIRSATHDVVVRTSMNLNENPRLENIEITENRDFAEYFEDVVTAIFAELKEGENLEGNVQLSDIQETFLFQEIEAPSIKLEDLSEPGYTHTLKKQ